jgi:prephenate dehydratase
MKLLTLGPAGTFSHEASQSLYPRADIELCANFDALFQRLEKHGGIGIVPVENSLHGPVDEVLDLLLHTEIKIWKAQDVAVRHCFGAKDPAAVKRVASHPQALSQCRLFLRKHYPEAEHFPVPSTTYAISLALEDPEIGAIASAKALREHGLPIAHEDVQPKGNTTRFALVSKDDPFPGSAKTQMSVVLHIKEDRPGVLHDLLTPFKVYDVSLTKIESRPTGQKLGDYVFFVDFVGTTDSARVQKVFEEIRRVADIRILGEW